MANVYHPLCGLLSLPVVTQSIMLRILRERNFMTRFPIPLRLLALGLAVGLAFTATLVWAAPGVSQVQTPRRGYDPLSPEEQERARTLAMQRAEFANALNAARRSEMLLIERHV